VPQPLYEIWRRRYRDAGPCGDAHGWVKKRLVENGVCAEIAVRDELASAPGWRAVWVRNGVGGGKGFLRFWETMPANLSDRNGGMDALPSWPTSVLDAIDPSWRAGGVLDVFAWNARRRDVRFAEVKRRSQDRLRPNQLEFIRKGQLAGWEPRCFIVVEWDLV
jgi:hypothetical protein